MEIVDTEVGLLFMCRRICVMKMILVALSFKFSNSKQWEIRSESDYMIESPWMAPWKWPQPQLFSFYYFFLKKEEKLQFHVWR